MRNPLLYATSILALILILGIGCANPPALPSTATVDQILTGRRIVVLRDRTISFGQHLEAANLEIDKIVLALGPGDEFIVVDIGPDFDPSRNVVAQCVMPELPPKLMQPATNLIEWNQKQAELKELWKLVEMNRAKMLNYFGNKPKLTPGGTYLEAPLLYSAKRFNTSGKQQKLGYLLIFSDVRTERGAMKTSLPPSHPGVFTQIDVQVFMAPWNSDGWGEVESAWRDWFVNVGHAKSFRMYDTAESPEINPLPPNPAPKALASPFQTARQGD